MTIAQLAEQMQKIFAVNSSNLNGGYFSISKAGGTSEVDALGATNSGSMCKNNKVCSGTNSGTECWNRGNCGPCDVA